MNFAVINLKEQFYLSCNFHRWFQYILDQFCPALQESVSECKQPIRKIWQLKLNKKVIKDLIEITIKYKYFITSIFSISARGILFSNSSKYLNAAK